SSRLGFIMLSVGCAVGLGNVWRFPFITGQYGGALFVIIYILFLVIFGIPVMTMEFAVGRGSGKSAARSFHVLEKTGTKWHLFGWAAMAGNYLLMMFYTTISGWMLAYMVKSAAGVFDGLSPEEVGGVFNALTASPASCAGWMTTATVLGFTVCAGGLEKSVEKITKVMMSCLFIILLVLVIRSVTLEGAAAGLAFYLKPNLGAIREHGLWTVVYAAMGQAFFTLSLGVGSMAIFGSYLGKDRRLFGESVAIAGLDTAVALMSGFVIFPACFAFNVNPGQGPGLVFVTLPNIFNAMSFGRIWGTLFFVFMAFAAMSTVVAVFENIIAFGMDITGCSRKKSCFINFIIVTLLSLPCALGFNLLSGVQPLGPGSMILDLEDFIVSNNLLPLGSIVYLLFCVSKKGWGWDSFIKEANMGSGWSFPAALRPYLTWGLPVLIILVFVFGYINKFAK
ncbi:MAG: sodium-dependent transporter, partial [Treponema sp.]|nr:sodium-dependent transporter [Treponema sp.]